MEKTDKYEVWASQTSNFKTQGMGDWVLKIYHDFPKLVAASLLFVHILVVAELSLSFGNNISFVDPEGANQPEWEDIKNGKWKNAVIMVLVNTIGRVGLYHVSRRREVKMEN